MTVQFSAASDGISECLESEQVHQEGGAFPSLSGCVNRLCARAMRSATGTPNGQRRSHAWQLMQSPPLADSER